MVYSQWNKQQLNHSINTSKSQHFVSKKEKGPQIMQYLSVCLCVCVGVSVGVCELCIYVVWRCAWSCVWDETWGTIESANSWTGNEVQVTAGSLITNHKLGPVFVCLCVCVFVLVFVFVCLCLCSCVCSCCVCVYVCVDRTIFLRVCICSCIYVENDVCAYLASNTIFWIFFQ